MTARCEECGYILSNDTAGCSRCKGLEIGKWSNGLRPRRAARLRAGKPAEGPDTGGCLMLTAVCTVLILGTALWHRSR